MTQAIHRIGRQVLDVEWDSQVLARAGEQRLRGLVYDQVAALLQRHFDQATSAGRLLRIERLEIDLGTLEHEHLSEQLLAALERQLPELLAGADAVVDEALGEDAGRGSITEELRCFVHEGVLPWWSERRGRAEFDRQVLTLLQRGHPSSLPSQAASSATAWWAGLVAEPRSRERVVIQFSDSVLRAWLGVLVAGSPVAEVEALVDLPRRVLRSEAGEAEAGEAAESSLDARRPPTRRQTRWERRKLLWLALFEAARQEPQAARVATQGLAAFARATGISAKELAHSLLDPSYPSGAPLDLATRGQAPRAGLKRPEASAPTPASRDTRENLTVDRETAPSDPNNKPVALRSDSAPGEPEPQSVHHETDARGLGRAPAARPPTHEGARLRDASSEDGSSDERASAPRDPSADAAPRPSPSTAHSPTADERLAPVETGVDTGEAPSREDHEPPVAPSRPGPTFTRVARRVPERRLEPAPSALATFDQLGPVSPDPRAHQNHLRSFSDLDCVYVSNAGLVLLWPFLGHFFRYLGLLEDEDERFVDEAARHRAALVLQGAVDDDREPPEFDLLLNKLLCGLDADSVLEVELPIRDPEAAEARRLLSAVVDRAAVLHGTSPEGLRSGFVARPGRLSAEPGYWLLQVETRTHDDLLTLLPWPFEWLRLPWMQAPMQVVW